MSGNACTRGGRDQFPAMNASIDSFIRHGLIENLPITFVNHAEGPHAFDLFDRIDSNVHSGRNRRQLAGDGGLADAWKATQHNEH